MKRFVCRLMLGVLVFGQMAIAAYACPALSGAPQSLPMMAMGASVATMPGDEAGASMAVSSDTSAAPDVVAMTGCDQIDDSAANLCAEHCRFGQQSADHAAAPTVPAALLTTLYTLPVQPEPVGHGRPSADWKFKHVTASPPLAILHCCFRI
ncbi:hypothetical protein SRS16CHR_04867 [Variovorax sp. SRS16]|uniref:hypothetical protein n=1 Tax=Variovorax sp. SRS16 TaxID=282217 RepID=UPI00131751DB|nr:hypothetical protein [Variovorax sp. SRS16]VTU31380.1 hypothetical protein SRS16CHR_04867 [Variovorax sp. SRS16]